MALSAPGGAALAGLAQVWTLEGSRGLRPLKIPLVAAPQCTRAQVETLRCPENPQWVAALSIQVADVEFLRRALKSLRGAPVQRLTWSEARRFGALTCLVGTRCVEGVRGRPILSGSVFSDGPVTLTWAAALALSQSLNALERWLQLVWGTGGRVAFDHLDDR